MVYLDNLLPLAQEIVKQFSNANMKIATAESCTGGSLATILTSVPGASRVFDYGYITYSNQAKIDMLGANPEIITKFGAVSLQTAEEMALGARTKSSSDIGISITGIAGPDGGSEDKPVGTVFIGLSTETITISHRFQFSGNREQIRLGSCREALILLSALQKN